MQWTLQPKGYVAFEHVHYNQDEIFFVKKGSLKVVMNGRDYFAETGQTLTVPKGVAHTAHNNSGGIMDCEVSYVPGLDQNTFMECFCGLVNDGLLDKKGGINIPRMGYFLTVMKAKCLARPTAIPAPVFALSLKVFYLMGLLRGWNKLYEKYTGHMA